MGYRGGAPAHLPLNVHFTALSGGASQPLIHRSIAPTHGLRAAAPNRIAPRPAASRPTEPHARTPCADLPPRSAAARISTACFATSSTSRSRCSASTRPGCGCTTARPRRSSSPPSAACRRDVLEIIATLPRDAPTAGMEAMRAHEVRVMRGDLSQTVPAVQAIYRARRHPDDLLCPDRVPRRTARASWSLYHHSDYGWTADETELARAFADHLATAISNARLASSTRTLAARLRVISRAGRSAEPPAGRARDRPDDRRPRRGS